METILNNGVGKTRSFLELFTLESAKVEIPKIQRDYAQGRESAFEIRKTFLKTIKKHLDENNPLNLDFVYGSIEHQKFIPIDGQQRLTTLFLLHWYMAWSSDELDHFKNLLLSGNTSNFTYDTRVSSREFCDNLLTKEINRSEEISISQTLKNQYWYYLNWKNDPTIVGMLNTLDSIEHIFSEDESKYYELLKRQNPSLITFQYIELKDFGLSDQLYIKMNSRGKPLTEFENLKANIERVFEENDHENHGDQTQWFTSKIDGVWVDYFWEFVNSDPTLLDSSIVNFIRAATIGLYASASKGHEETLRDLLNSTKTFNYYLLEKSGLARFESLKEVFQQLDRLIQFNMSNTKTSLKGYLIDLDSLVSDVLNQKISYPNRVIFYALLKYLTNYDDYSGLLDWMRVIRNLAENHRIDSQETMTASIRRVDSLLQYGADISDYLAKAELKDLTGFSTYQGNEEIFKASLMVQNPQWRQIIERNENHPYLQGHIGFLFKFSGVNISFDESAEIRFHNYNWSEIEILFNDYSTKFFKLFHDAGLKPMDGFLFERALLTQGDYLLRKGRNFSFLIDNERDISWKRLLRDSKNKILKSLMDRIDISGIHESLEEMINDFNDQDWRYYFIKFAKILAQTGRNKFIRTRWDNKNDILLLEKTQTNGTHREYYSYAILCELERLGYQVSYQSAASDQYYKSIDSINDLEINIRFDPDEEFDRYRIDFEGKVTHPKSHDEVIAFVKKGLI
jgi:hypothetical protein